MTNDNPVAIKHTNIFLEMNAILKRVGDSMSWVKCPLCHCEWNKLQPSTYYVDGKAVETHACPRCTEGVRSIEKLQDLMPIPGAEIAIFKRRGFQNYPIALEELPTAWWATVTYTSMSFKVEPQSSGHLKVTYAKDADNPSFYDSIFKAWMAMKTKFEKGEDVEPKSDWGSIRKMAVKSR